MISSLDGKPVSQLDVEELTVTYSAEPTPLVGLVLTEQGRDVLVTLVPDAAANLVTILVRLLAEKHPERLLAAGMLRAQARV